MIINSDELKNIQGGSIKLTAALVVATVKAATFICQLGQYAGSALRRYSTKSYC